MQEQIPMDVERFDDIITVLTPHYIRMLEAVYSFENRWASRLQIALALGKRRLTPYDHRALQFLASEGVIEVTTRPVASTITDIMYLYRVPDAVADLMIEWTEWRKTNGNRPILRTRKPIKFIEHLAGTG
jgi:hypothetical protein